VLDVLVLPDGLPVRRVGEHRVHLLDGRPRIGEAVAHAFHGHIMSAVGALGPPASKTRKRSDHVPPWRFAPAAAEREPHPVVITRASSSNANVAGTRAFGAGSRPRLRSCSSEPRSPSREDADTEPTVTPWRWAVARADARTPISETVGRSNLAAAAAPGDQQAVALPIRRCSSVRGLRKTSVPGLLARLIGRVEASTTVPW